MSDVPGPILYMSGTLPTLSETFVTTEVLGLRRMGFDVRTASVHAPESGLGSAELDAIADETVRIYPESKAAFLAYAMAAIAATPVQSAKTLWRALRDALGSSGIGWSRRAKIMWQALAGISLAHRVNEMGIVHIHAHMAHVPTTIGMYAAMQMGVRFSFTGHAVDLFKERTLLEEKLERCAFVSCISRWHRDYYKGTVAIEDARAPVIRCGVPIPAERERPILSEGVPSVLAVGRLVSKKGFDTLLRALAAMRGEGVEIRADLVGDGPERERLESLCESLGLGDGLLMHGALPNARIREIMMGSDLFVLPCRTATDGDRDGIPVVLMEAMSSGMCAISGDLPAIRELVEDGETGVIVPPDDPERLAEALRGLIDDPAGALRIAQRGREWVKREFSDDVNLERLAVSIRQCLSGASVSSAGRDS